MTSMKGNWQIIQSKLVEYLGICNCQRKIKSIISILLTIRHKIQEGDNLSPEELLIANLLEKENIFMHGINAEYPMIDDTTDFWNWIIIIKENPEIIDN